jgi:hypothetical protein
MHMNVYTCMCTYTCIYMHILPLHMHVYTCIYTYTCIYMYMHVGACTYTHMDVYACIYMYMHAYPCVCMHVFMMNILQGTQPISTFWPTFIIGKPGTCLINIFSPVLNHNKLGCFSLFSLVPGPVR